jgi:hypothetical protein
MAIVTNGKSTFLFRKPGAPNVLLVTNKLVNEIVVLIPAKITDNSNISCAPTAVYFFEEENGVIKVHPAVVCVLSEHFVKYTFFRLFSPNLSIKYQKLSAYLTKLSSINKRVGLLL